MCLCPLFFRLYSQQLVQFVPEAKRFFKSFSLQPGTGKLRSKNLDFYPAKHLTTTISKISSDQRFEILSDKCELILFGSSHVLVLSPVISWKIRPTLALYC